MGVEYFTRGAERQRSPERFGFLCLRERSGLRCARAGAAGARNGRPSVGSTPSPPEADDRYLALAGSGRSELREKGSRFLGQAVPVASEQAARRTVGEVAVRHHDATHHCWALVLGHGDQAGLDRTAWTRRRLREDRGGSNDQTPRTASALDTGTSSNIHRTQQEADAPPIHRTCRSKPSGCLGVLPVIRTSNRWSQGAIFKGPCLPQSRIRQSFGAWRAYSEGSPDGSAQGRSRNLEAQVVQSLSTRNRVGRLTARSSLRRERRGPVLGGLLGVESHQHLGDRRV